MSSNYPGALDSFTTKQDGIDTVAASHVNDLQDAVVAIETELGIDPKGDYASVAAALAGKLDTSGGNVSGNVTCDPGVTIDGEDISALVDKNARMHTFWLYNSVNACSTDSSGYPNFLSAGTGLAVNIAASSVPLEMDIAGYYQILDEDSAIEDLTASSTLYLYAERGTGETPSFGFSALAPVYAYTTPSTPSTDQHWMDLASGKMKRYTGSAWEEKLRIFIGEATTGESSVTGVINYALRGSYDSGWFAVEDNTAYAKNHNMGMLPGDLELFGATSDSGANMHKVDYYHNGTSGYGGRIGSLTRLDLSLNGTAGYDYPIAYGSGSSSDSGYYRVNAKRGW